MYFFLVKRESVSPPLSSESLIQNHYLHFTQLPLKRGLHFHNMKKALFTTLPLLMLGLIWVTSCKKKTPEVISGFTFVVDATDFKKVTFTNASQNYSGVSWDFGDGSTSTELNPVHSYAAVGNYTVTLTATNDEGDTDVSSQAVGISDPDAELTKLVGDVSKTWKLLRVTAPGSWPL